ncbi:glioma pathogenesis-related protein 1-like [Hemicordylus capensis]|uniref:glioma pathogenesis-related protein 1-like n=1 Tax=Hemicordylus capensis TaxID=884348 RepID=UPI0023025D90|nr:glioma pathogenesis-related protein 1-like [Hemicordylus capensis]
MLYWDEQGQTTVIPLLKIQESTARSVDKLPDIGNALFIEECVRVHNQFRSNVEPPASNMKRMSWDSDLAKTARAWAKMCQFNHNPDLKSGKAHPTFRAVGENIWTGSLSLFNVTAALTHWHNEVQSYNYNTRDCSNVCGHYTQMVWAESYKIGCAVHFCLNVQGFGPNAAHFICNYGPGGNYPTRPYHEGAACSECPGEPCVHRLCGEFWEPPSCDQYCITILILRLLSVLLTFAAVLIVQRNYPKMSTDFVTKGAEGKSDDY